MNKTAEELPLYRIAANEPGPRVLVTAGVHGDEYEPMLAAVELAGKLPDILNRGSITIVPIVNTSAYSIGGRCGKDGLDLARICPGNLDGSETEIAAAQISELIRQADYYIDLHSGGTLFDIHPLTGYMLHASPDILRKQQDMAKAFNLPVVWGTDYSTNGRTLSIARDANVPAIYAEYGGGGRVRKSIVNAYREGCLNILKTLNMICTHDSIEPDISYWVEDYTPNAGYLQGKMPAPAEGIFVSELSLGSAVINGQLWGLISNPLNGDQKEIMADADGIVLFLRIPAYVREGDSLGGILPISKPGKIIIHGK